jgi:indole-3-glycerol phosphate synthase
MNTILSLILENGKRKVRLLRANREALSALAKKASKPRNFKEALQRQDKISLIAEIKQASPSSGILRKDFVLKDIAKIYEKCKANAISVLTEEEFFLGKLNYIEAVKKAVSLPVLRKDFIIDEMQIIESRAAGADAVLLITRILDDEKFKKLYDLSRSLGMDVLAEVHSEKELRKVLQIGCDIIGINSRNLSTLKVETDRFAKLAPFIPAGVVKVAESGVDNAKEAMLLKGLGFEAMLVGSAFMKAPNIEEKVKELNIDA